MSWKWRQSGHTVDHLLPLECVALPLTVAHCATDTVVRQTRQDRQMGKKEDLLRTEMNDPPPPLLAFKHEKEEEKRDKRGYESKQVHERRLVHFPGSSCPPPSFFLSWLFLPNSSIFCLLLLLFSFLFAKCTRKKYDAADSTFFAPKLTFFRSGAEARS